ncbi:MAG: putative ABC transporter permease [Olsenella sp.]|nr:putative ABC transporter permease [Olsenella sp.]
MESDELADDAARITVIAVHNSDRERTKSARQREREARRKANADHRAATRAARKAYDAIRFSAPNRLGFMRAVQVAFAFHIISTLLGLLVTSRNSIQYTSGTIFDWAMIILEGVALWFIMNRYKVARPFTIAVGCMGIAYNVGAAVAAGELHLLTLVSNSLFYLVLIGYFALSKRVRVVCMNDFGRGQGFYNKDDFVIDRRSWAFFRNLIMYFVIFSVFGHWMEAGFCQLIRLGLVSGKYDPSNTMLWRDWLYPFPMEGAAVVIIGLALYPLKEWLDKKFSNPFVPYVLSFLANMLTCSCIEFSMGLIVNSNHQLWDYSNGFCNIMGQVCLQNALGFGVAASVITWFIYPLLERWIARMPEHIVNIAFVVIAIFGGILWSLYIVDPPESLTGEVQQEEVAVAENVASDEREAALVGVLATTVDLADVQDKVEKDPSLTPEQRQQTTDKIHETIDRLNEVSSLLSAG